LSIVKLPYFDGSAANVDVRRARAAIPFFARLRWSGRRGCARAVAPARDRDLQVNKAIVSRW
jgi:hypothetical protein